MKSLRKIFLMLLVAAFICNFSVIGASACDCDHDHKHHLEQEANYHFLESDLVDADSENNEGICINCGACCSSFQYISQYSSNSDYILNESSLNLSLFFDNNFKSHHIEVLKSPPKA